MYIVPVSFILRLSIHVLCSADYIQRSAGDFGVNGANIEPDDAERGEYDANQEDYEDCQLRRAGDAPAERVAEEILFDYDECAEQPRKARYGDAEVAGEPQRHE